MKKKIILGLVAAAILIQFIPYGKDHTNPQVLSEVKWDSTKTKELFDKACMDCHSNKTIWPWYANIAPISWMVQHHVEDGRRHFNVSMWGHQRKNKGDDAAHEVQKGEMPMLSYIIAHPEAKLSNDEKTLLIQGLKNTFGEDERHKH